MICEITRLMPTTSSAMIRVRHLRECLRSLNQRDQAERNERDNAANRRDQRDRPGDHGEDEGVRDAHPRKLDEGQHADGEADQHLPAKEAVPDVHHLVDEQRRIRADRRAEPGARSSCWVCGMSSSTRNETNSASRKLPMKPVMLPIAEVTVCETEPNSGRIWLIRSAQRDLLRRDRIAHLLQAAGSRSSGRLSRCSRMLLRRPHQIGQIDLHAEDVQHGVLRA